MENSDYPMGSNSSKTVLHYYLYPETTEYGDAIRLEKFSSKKQKNKMSKGIFLDVVEMHIPDINNKPTKMFQVNFKYCSSPDNCGEDQRYIRKISDLENLIENKQELYFEFLTGRKMRGVGTPTYRKSKKSIQSKNTNISRQLVNNLSKIKIPKIKL